MSNRIPDDIISAAGFGETPSAPPPKPARIKMTIEAADYPTQVFEGVAVLAGMALGNVQDSSATSNWMANINHEVGALILASLLSTMRENFGQRCIDVALELSRTTRNSPLIEPPPDEQKSDDATGGG